MTRDEALTIVREHIKNENLIKHMLSVEAVMRFYAEKLGEDVETWGILGLLHDFDWEIHPTLEEHPIKGAPILRERGVDEELIQDILLLELLIQLYCLQRSLCLSSEVGLLVC